MHDWFSKLALQRDRANADTFALNHKARALWRGLVVMIETVCAIYLDRYPHAPDSFTLEYEATDNTVTVRKRRMGGPAPQEVAAVTVSCNQSVVTILYTSVVHDPSLFAIGRDSEGYVVILLDGKPVATDRVAELILRPVLFSDLPG